MTAWPGPTASTIPSGDTVATAGLSETNRSASVASDGVLVTWRAWLCPWAVRVREVSMARPVQDTALLEGGTDTAGSLELPR